MTLVPEPLRIPSFRAFWLARLATTIAQMAMVMFSVAALLGVARAFAIPLKVTPGPPGRRRVTLHVLEHRLQSWVVARGEVRPLPASDD